MKRLILFVVLLLGCSSVDEIQPTFNRERQVISVTVENYSTMQSLEDAAKDPHRGLKGQATYNNVDNDCNIKIYKPKTVTVDDDYALTLGHELMHCLYGDYH